MKKRFLTGLVMAAALGMMTAGSALAANGIAVGPPALDVDVSESGVGTASVYITSDMDGEVHVGTEGLPLKVEPATFSVASGDEYKTVELTFQPDETAATGSYPGKLTFLIYAGGNVAYGVKIKVNAEIVGGEGVAPYPTGTIAETPLYPPEADTNGPSFLIIAASVVGAVVALVVGVRAARRHKRSDL